MVSSSEIRVLSDLRICLLWSSHIPFSADSLKIGRGLEVLRVLPDVSKVFRGCWLFPALSFRRAQGNPWDDSSYVVKTLRLFSLICALQLGKEWTWKDQVEENW